MGNLQIGQSITLDAGWYSLASKVREILRLSGFDFQFKLGKGLLTVRRTA